MRPRAAVTQAMGILAILDIILETVDQRLFSFHGKLIISHLFAQRTARNMALYTTHKITSFVKTSLRHATCLTYFKSALARNKLRYNLASILISCIYYILYYITQILKLTKNLCKIQLHAMTIQFHKMKSRFCDCFVDLKVVEFG